MKTLFAAVVIALAASGAQAQGPPAFLSEPTYSSYAKPPVGYLPTLPGYVPQSRYGNFDGYGSGGVTFCQSMGDGTSYCYR